MENGISGCLRSRDLSIFFVRSAPADGGISLKLAAHYTTLRVATQLDRRISNSRVVCVSLRLRLAVLGPVLSRVAFSREERTCWFFPTLYCDSRK